MFYFRCLLFPLSLIISGACVNLLDLVLDNNSTTLNSNLIVEVIENYREDFGLIFHIDSSSEHLVNKILLTHSHPSTVYHYDKVKKIMKRPEGAQYVNVVLLRDPVNFSRFLNRKSNVCVHDVVLFLNGSPQHSTFPSLSKFGRILVLGTGIQEICFHCGSPDTDLFPKKLKNMNRQLLKVAYVDYFPYIYCTRRRGTVCAKAIGIEYQFLETLSRMLNFSYELVSVPNDSFTILYEGLVAQKYDFAIGGLTITNERRTLLQFTDLIRYGKVTFTFVHDSLFITDIDFFSLVRADIRVALFVLLSLVALLIYLSKKCFSHRLSFGKIWGALGRSTFEQTVKYDVKVNASVSLIFGIWWIFIMVVNIILKCQLIAAMVTKSPPKITLEQLTNRGYKVVLARAASASFLKGFSEEEQVMITSPSATYKSNICQVLEVVENEKGITIGELARALYHNTIYCSDHYNKTLNHRMHYSFYNVRLTPHAWPINFAAPYVEAFSQIMRQLESGGFPEAWEKQVLLERRLHGLSIREKAKVITFKSLAGHFFMYSLMSGASVVCFIFEVAYHKWGRKLKIKF